MANDILCPSCGHSLAFHKFDYGSCEAPLGGLTSKNMCGCPFTVHTYIQNLQADETVKKFWRLEEKYKTAMDEIAISIDLMKLAKKKIEFLELKLKTIRELLDKINSIEKTSPGSWFGFGYRNEVTKIIDEIKLELEKDMEDG